MDEKDRPERGGASPAWTDAHLIPKSPEPIRHRAVDAGAGRYLAYQARHPLEEVTPRHVPIRLGPAGPQPHLRGRQHAVTENTGCM